MFELRLKKKIKAQKHLLFLNMENELKCSKETNFVTELSIIQMNPSVRSQITHLHRSPSAILICIQSCRNNLLQEAHLAYPTGRINHYTIK